jgi:hypothetical protein
MERIVSSTWEAGKTLHFLEHLDGIPVTGVRRRIIDTKVHIDDLWLFIPR